MVNETVHHTSPFFPSVQVILWDPWGERESGAEEKRGEGSSLSPINIMSMGVQNGLCQQNTDLLSGEEHEDERAGWEESKGRERYYHGILQVCVLYETPYISLITRNVVKIYERHRVENFNMWNPSLLGEYQLQHCNHCNIFQFQNTSQCLNNSLNWFSKDFFHECFISFTFVKNDSFVGNSAFLQCAPIKQLV